MNSDYQIDDLLKVVHPDLVKSWEENNLDPLNKFVRNVFPDLWKAESANEKEISVGLLQEITEKHKVNESLQNTLMIKLVAWFIFAVIGGMALFCSAVYAYPHSMPYSFVVVLMPISFVTFWAKRFVEPRVKRSRAVCVNCQHILELFKNSVEKLNPLGITPHWKIIITESFVREILTDFAERVLDAEEKFQSARQGASTVTEVVSAGQWVWKCQENLESTWEEAAEFGLEFKKSNIFANAKAKLAKSTIENEFAK